MAAGARGLEWDGVLLAELASRLRTSKKMSVAQYRQSVRNMIVNNAVCKDEKAFKTLVEHLANQMRQTLNKLVYETGVADSPGSSTFATPSPSGCSVAGLQTPVATRASSTDCSFSGRVAAAASAAAASASGGDASMSAARWLRFTPASTHSSAAVSFVTPGPAQVDDVLDWSEIAYAQFQLQVAVLQLWFPWKKVVPRLADLWLDLLQKTLATRLLETEGKTPSGIDLYELQAHLQATVALRTQRDLSDRGEAEQVAGQQFSDLLAGKVHFEKLNQQSGETQQYKSVSGGYAGEKSQWLFSSPLFSTLRAVSCFARHVALPESLTHNAKFLSWVVGMSGASPGVLAYFVSTATAKHDHAANVFLRTTATTDLLTEEIKRTCKVLATIEQGSDMVCDHATKLAMTDRADAVLKSQQEIFETAITKMFPLLMQRWHCSLDEPDNWLSALRTMVHTGNYWPLLVPVVEAPAASAAANASILNKPSDDRARRMVACMQKIMPLGADQSEEQEGIDAVSLPMTTDCSPVRLEMILALWFELRADQREFPGDGPLAQVAVHGVGVLPQLWLRHCDGPVDERVQPWLSAVVDLFALPQRSTSSAGERSAILGLRCQLMQAVLTKSWNTKRLAAELNAADFQHYDDAHDHRVIFLRLLAGVASMLTNASAVEKAMVRRLMILEWERVAGADAEAFPKASPQARLAALGRAVVRIITGTHDRPVINLRELFPDNMPSKRGLTEFDRQRFIAFLSFEGIAAGRFFCF